MIDKKVPGAASQDSLAGLTLIAELLIVGYVPLKVGKILRKQTVTLLGLNEKFVPFAVITVVRSNWL